MGIQNSINNIVNSATRVAGANFIKNKGSEIMDNQKAQIKAQEHLQDQLTNIQNFKYQIKNDFRPQNYVDNEKYMSGEITIDDTRGVADVKGFTADVVGGKK